MCGLGVLRLVASGMLWMILVGEALGLSAFVLNRVMETMVFGVKTTDAATYAWVTAMLAVVAIVACALPPQGRRTSTPRER